MADPMTNIRPDRGKEPKPMRKLFCLAAMVLILFCGGPVFGADETAKENPTYIIKTSMGDIAVELFATDAPKTVRNFIDLAAGNKEFTDPKTKQKAKTAFL